MLRWGRCLPTSDFLWQGREGGSGLPLKKMTSFVNSPIAIVRVAFSSYVLVATFLCLLQPCMYSFHGSTSCQSSVLPPCSKQTYYTSCLKSWCISICLNTYSLTFGEGNKIIYENLKFGNIPSTIILLSQVGNIPSPW